MDKRLGDQLKPPRVGCGRTGFVLLLLRDWTHSEPLMGRASMDCEQGRSHGIPSGTDGQKREEDYKMVQQFPAKALER